MYCPTTTTPLMLNGTIRTRNLTNVTILLHICDLKNNKNCNTNVYDTANLL